MEVLERKGLCTKEELYDIITEFRHKKISASIPETVFLDPYLLAETESKILDNIEAIPNTCGETICNSEHYQ